jgi:hypothetical protein
VVALACVCQLYTAIRTHCEAFMPGMADDALDAIAELHRVSHTHGDRRQPTRVT